VGPKYPPFKENPAHNNPPPLKKEFFKTPIKKKAAKKNGPVKIKWPNPVGKEGITNKIP